MLRFTETTQIEILPSDIYEPLGKQAYSNILIILPPKNENIFRQKI